MIRAAVIDNGLSWIDALTHWLCNTRPAGPFTVERRWYAVRNFRPSAAPTAAAPARMLL